MKPYDRPTDTLPISRRTVIMNAGLAAAAIAGLSSCTNYSTAPNSEPSAPATGGSSGAAGPLTVQETDIPVGSGKIFPDAQTVITQPKNGEFKAFSAVCTHQGCIVATVTDTINCDCHGSKYSITDGSVVNPPAPKPLPPKTIKVDGDSLTVS
ncbi:MAG TPA: Rieske (2Fe-2S) protein [Propionibacteriaceae bacterium]|nr:Rieske (2Fe-2S) protein [Propionibacteriaceae bacterium]